MNVQLVMAGRLSLLILVAVLAPSTQVIGKPWGEWFTPAMPAQIDLGGYFRRVQSPSFTLNSTVDAWLATSDRFRGSGALVAGRPLPDELTAARAAFETAWRNNGLRERKDVPYAKMGKALAMIVRSYRFQETYNPSPSIALEWADEMIKYYEQVADRRELTEAKLEKAAIYLQVSQLNHTDRERFKRLSEDGDKLLQDCIGTAEPEQRIEVYRFWSRFYYNLARPQTGQLSDRWDDRFLRLADQRIDDALKLAPDSLRNLNQKARVVQRRARQSLDAPSVVWEEALWQVQSRFKTAWQRESPNIARVDDKISSQNVLAMVTLDAVTYSALVTENGRKAQLAVEWLRAIDEVGLPVQLEVWATVRNTELARAYGFDTVYDLARLYALRAIVTGILGTGRQNEDIDKTIDYLRDARGLATVNQLDAAKKSAAGDPVFTGLPEFARNSLRRTLDGAP